MFERIHLIFTLIRIHLHSRVPCTTKAATFKLLVIVTVQPAGIVQMLVSPQNVCKASDVIDDLIEKIEG
jgi:hypothetical protein